MLVVFELVMYMPLNLAPVIRMHVLPPPPPPPPTHTHPQAGLKGQARGGRRAKELSRQIKMRLLQMKQMYKRAQRLTDLQVGGGGGVRVCGVMGGVGGWVGG
jgi:hypothetical protein